MKKKYFAPEMEEVNLDEPFVLAEAETSGGSETLCTTKTCESDSCPTDYD
jgi:hypothetical protein